MGSAGQLQFVHLLLSRLERVPADSPWAHRASGLRGALLEALEGMEQGSRVEESKLSALTESALRVLNHSAREKIRPAAGYPAGARGHVGLKHHK